MTELSEKLIEEKFKNVNEKLDNQEYDIVELKKKVSDVDIHVTKVDKDNSVMIERLLGMIEPLSKLPDALDNLSKSNVNMQISMNDMKNTLNENTKKITEIDNKYDKKVDDLDNQIKTINKENNISILGFIKKHALAFGIGVVFIIGVGMWAVQNFAFK